MLSAAIRNISAIGLPEVISDGAATVLNITSPSIFNSSVPIVRDNPHSWNECLQQYEHFRHQNNHHYNHGSSQVYQSLPNTTTLSPFNLTTSAISETNITTDSANGTATDSDSSLQQQLMGNFASQILNNGTGFDSEDSSGSGGNGSGAGVADASGAIYEPTALGLDSGAINGTLFCSPVWDGFYCWPVTRAGVRVERYCLEIFNSIVDLPKHVFAIEAKSALAVRECNQNGTWTNNWTNYTECLQMLINKESVLQNSGQSQTIREVVIFILFFCSIVSLVLLLVTFFIFTYFKSLACCRLRVHRNLVLALIIHSLLLIILSSPQLFGHLVNWPSYRNIEWLCKSILTLKLYSTLASINWMFIEGLLLHSRITVSIFRKDAPFRLYYFIGWGLPAIVVLIWALQMSLTLYTECWKGYGDSIFIWIIVGPMIMALLINCIFLVNIIRILVTKLRLMATIELNQIRKAIKATALLFPLLGISHLLFCINPDDNGKLEDAYMMVNAFLQSSQGIFVSVLYCFMDSEIQQVLRNFYHRTKFLKSGISFNHHHHRHQQQHWSLSPSCRIPAMQSNGICFRSRSYQNSQTSISYFANSTMAMMMTEMAQTTTQSNITRSNSADKQPDQNNSTRLESPESPLAVTSLWSQPQFAFCSGRYSGRKNGGICRQTSNESIRSQQEGMAPAGHKASRCHKPNNSRKHPSSYNGHSFDATNSTPNIEGVDLHQNHKRCINYSNRKLFSFETSSIQSSRSLEMVPIRTTTNNGHHHSNGSAVGGSNSTSTPPPPTSDKRRNMCIVYNAKGEMVRFGGGLRTANGNSRKPDKSAISETVDSPSRIFPFTNNRRYLNLKKKQPKPTKQPKAAKPAKVKQVKPESNKKFKLKNIETITNTTNAT